MWKKEEKKGGGKDKGCWKEDFVTNWVEESIDKNKSLPLIGCFESIISEPKKVNSPGIPDK